MLILNMWHRSENERSVHWNIITDHSAVPQPQIPLQKSCVLFTMQVQQTYTLLYSFAKFDLWSPNSVLMKNFPNNKCFLIFQEQKGKTTTTTNHQKTLTPLECLKYCVFLHIWILELIASAWTSVWKRLPVSLAQLQPWKNLFIFPAAG